MRKICDKNILIDQYFLTISKFLKKKYSKTFQVTSNIKSTLI